MKHVWSILVSRNTAIVLLISVSLVLLFGAALPNPGLMPPADAGKLKIDSPLLYWLGDHFNSMRIGKSPIFGLIGVLLIISTVFCSIDRVFKRIRSEPESFRKLPDEGTGLTIATPPDGRQNLLKLLKRDRWSISQVDRAGGSVLIARKGEFGFWGSIFFHAVLVTLIAGLIIFYCFGFRATLLFTEGQERTLALEHFSIVEKTPLFGVGLPDLRFKFNRFSAEYFDDTTATDYSADFDVFFNGSGTSSRRILKVNTPFSYAGLDFMLNLHWYSPNFQLYKKGAPVIDSYIALKPDTENTDTFDVEEEHLHVTAQFFPNLVRNNDGSVYSKGERPGNPYFGLNVTQGGKTVFRGLLGLGNSVTFGDYKLVFNDLRHWVTLEVVRETGIGFFFASAMLGLAGLLVRVMDPEKKIVAVVTDDGKKMTFFLVTRHFEGLQREYLSGVVDQLTLDRMEA